MTKSLRSTGDESQRPTDVQIVPRSVREGDLAPAQLLAYRSGPERNADRLYAALDGSELRVSGRCFEIDVYSVTDQRTERWLQIGLRGTHAHLITLRIKKDSGLQDVAAALADWLADPAHIEEVLDVA
jgi:hypothetical protein